MGKTIASISRHTLSRLTFVVKQRQHGLHNHSAHASQILRSHRHPEAQEQIDRSLKSLLKGQKPSHGSSCSPSMTHGTSPLWNATSTKAARNIISRTRTGRPSIHM